MLTLFTQAPLSSLSCCRGVISDKLCEQLGTGTQARATAGYKGNPRCLAGLEANGEEK